MRPPPGGAEALGVQEQRFIAERLKRHPVWATEVGDQSYERQLDGASAADRASELAWLDETIEVLKNGIDPAALSVDERSDLDLLLRRATADRLLLRERAAWSRDPVRWLEVAAASVQVGHGR